MLETIAMWGGIAGIAVAVFAIIILFLTKLNINHALNKDAILIDENFHIKQTAIAKAMEVVDEIVENGELVRTTPAFIQKAKLAYNELLCVLTDVRIADEFYNITMEEEVRFNEARIAQFKLMCRKDIGLKIGKANGVRRVLAKQAKQKREEQLSQRAQAMPQPPVQPMQQPIQYAQAPQQTVQQPQPAPQPRPVQPRPMQPAQPMARPVQSTQPKPVQPQARPVQPVQPMRRPEEPRNGNQ